MLLQKQEYYPAAGILMRLLSTACFWIGSLLLSFSVDEVTKKVAPKMAAANKIALIFIIIGFYVMFRIDF